MSMQKSCKGQCGNSYCCSIGMNYIPLTLEADTITDLIKLHLFRKSRVYKVSVPKFQGYVAIYEQPCKYIKKGKCAINDKKPNFCKTYPDTTIFTILPKACPFSRYVTTLETLEEIKIKDLK